MQKKRNGALDFWKFVFSIMIIIFHAKNMAVNETPLFTGGSIGVEFFFIVSGMLMANSSARKPDTSLSLGQDTFQFMKRKISGLMPNLYIAWLIGFIVEHYGHYSVKRMLRDAASAVWELLFVTESGMVGYRANQVCWYISAMLIAMLIIYPFMRKYKDTYFYVLAPVAIIFIMGLTYHNWKNLRLPHAWRGFAYKSMIRAFLEIMIGTVGYKLAAALREVSYTKLSKALFTLAEWGMFGFVIVWSYHHDGNKTDWLLVLLLTLAISITFAQVDLLDDFFAEHSLFNWLGTLSFSLYLGHGYWSHIMVDLFPEWSYRQRLSLYLVLAAVTGLFIMYSSKALKKWWGKNRTRCLSLFIAHP